MPRRLINIFKSGKYMNPTDQASIRRSAVHIYNFEVCKCSEEFEKKHQKLPHLTLPLKEKQVVYRFMYWVATKDVTPNASSSGSNFEDYSSDDPDWILEPIEIFCFDPLELTDECKRSVYFGTPVKNKKSRKKEQNKQAAIRYRMKKKAKMEKILEEERQLMQKNEVLETSITDLQRQIKYFRIIIRDLCKRKRLIS